MVAESVSDDGDGDLDLFVGDLSGAPEIRLSLSRQDIWTRRVTEPSRGSLSAGSCRRIMGRYKMGLFRKIGV